MTNRLARLIEPQPQQIRTLINQGVVAAHNPVDASEYRLLDKPGAGERIRERSGEYQPTTLDRSRRTNALESVEREAEGIAPASRLAYQRGPREAGRSPRGLA